MKVPELLGAFVRRILHLPYYLITAIVLLFNELAKLYSILRTPATKGRSMGWGNIYKRRMKVFTLAFLIYVDYKVSISLIFLSI